MKTLLPWVAASAIGLMLLVGGLLLTVYGFNSREVDACESTNEVRSVLVDIIDRGDANLRKLKDEGTLTTDQLRRSLKISRDARFKLAPTTCE